MAALVQPESYKEMILFLGTAGVVVPLFSRIRVSPVLGFIGAGALIGPYGLGRFEGAAPWLRWITVGNRDEFQHLAEFGVVFLLFTIGIELSWERLRVLRRLVFGLGAAQVFCCTAALAGTGMALGLRPGYAVLAGIALALSSTAIVIPILAGQRRLNSPTGRATFSVMLFQDLAVAPVLFTITAVDAAQGGNILPSLSLSLLQAAVALVVIVVAGRVALRPLFTLVAQTRSPELFMATCLLVVVGTALVAATSGLSMALGAFVAGLLLAETEFRRAIEATVEPFKGLLLGVFFVSIGMSLDVTAVAGAPLAVLSAAIGVVLIKTAITFGLALAFRIPARVAFETGLLLGPGGEFAFVLLGAAVASKLLPGDVGASLLVVTTVTMIAIPFLARLARRYGRRIAAQAEAGLPVEAPSYEAGNHVIVAGFGRVGQLVADMLTRHGVPYLAIDANPALVATQRGTGKPVYVGDSTSAAFLNACGIETARALVITLDSAQAIQAIVETVRGWRPDLTVVVRARDARHARDLYAMGVTDAVPETIEASLQLSEAVLVDIGIAAGPVIASIHERRDEFRHAFQKAARDGGVEQKSVERLGTFRARRTAGKR